MSRVMVVCCEGRTEEEYFKILRDRVYRIPGYIKIEIQGEKGQHKALIDRAVQARAVLAEAEQIDIGEIDCWAVCDDDGMAIPYGILEAYAAERGVCLAFSRPQFESYLLQHFEQSRETRPTELYRRLTDIKNDRGFEGAYEKTNLDWLEHTLVDKPKLVDIAVTNSDQRLKRSSSPFLTAQNLTKRLRGLRRR